MSLEDFGLHAKILIAGFAGGVVYSIVVKHRRPISVVSSAIAGTLTANYFGPVASHYVGSWMSDEGQGFLVGLTAMATCQGLVVLASTKFRNGTLIRDDPGKEVRP